MNNPEHLRTHSYRFFRERHLARCARILLLTLGLRYEYNSPAVGCRESRAGLQSGHGHRWSKWARTDSRRAATTRDYHNFAPHHRAGVVAARAQRNGAPRGLRDPLRSVLARAGRRPVLQRALLQFQCLLSDSGLVNLSLDNPFPSNFPFPYPASAIAFQRNLRTPYIQQWNFGIQQQLGTSRVLEVAYVGSKGTHLIDSRNINQPQPSRIRTPAPESRISPKSTSSSRRPTRFITACRRGSSSGCGRDCRCSASYTYAKSIDDASGFFSTTGDPNFPQNSYDLSAERGRSDFDIRQRFTLSYAYDLPIAKGHRWLGGWQSFGVLTFQTGQPFTVALLPDNDNANTGQSAARFRRERPAERRGQSQACRIRRPSEWFNTAAFAIAAVRAFRQRRTQHSGWPRPGDGKLLDREKHGAGRAAHRPVPHRIFQSAESHEFQSAG